MFENILEFLEPVLNVFTAVVILCLGITLCVGCIILALKACGRFNAFVREKAEKTINKWTRRADNVVVRIGERIGHSVMETIGKLKSDIPVDQRPQMIGDWISTDGDYMTISGHKGYYRVKFFGEGVPKHILDQDFVLRDIQGWLHDDNVYCAESHDLLTLGVSTAVDEIFVPELKRTYCRCKYDLKPSAVPFNPEDFIIHHDAEPQSELSEACRKAVEEAFAESDIKSSGTSFDDINRNILQ